MQIEIQCQRVSLRKENENVTLHEVVLSTVENSERYGVAHLSSKWCGCRKVVVIRDRRRLLLATRRPRTGQTKTSGLRMRLLANSCSLRGREVQNVLRICTEARNVSDNMAQVPEARKRARKNQKVLHCYVNRY